MQANSHRALAIAFLLGALSLSTHADISAEKPAPKAKEINISVTVQSLIPNYDTALKSPVPRLLELIYVIDQNLIEYTWNYLYPEVVKAYGADEVNENMRAWYVELYEHRGLDRVVIERISFVANRATVGYTIVMKDGETNHETSEFILDDKGQWYLNDRDL